jgi:ABC-type dipeptide/oligopeptide/nickel transport system permease component
METLPQGNDSGCISFVNLIKKRTEAVLISIFFTCVVFSTSVFNGSGVKTLQNDFDDFAKTYSVSFMQIPYFWVPLFLTASTTHRTWLSNLFRNRK